MEANNINEKLDRIESRLKKLEGKKKDFWDIFQSLAAVLIPAAIALAGYLISNGIKQAEIDVAETNAKVSQAELINKFMTSLTSESPVERSLAVDAIMIAIPGHGASLARAVAENDSSEAVKEAAKSSLNKRLMQLIGNLFSDQAEIRTRAAQDLLQGWSSEPQLVEHLLEYANNHDSNVNGIYNTVVIFNSMDRQPLLEYKEAVLGFLSSAEQIGPKTRQVAEQVRRRL